MWYKLINKILLFFFYTETKYRIVKFWIFWWALVNTKFASCSMKILHPSRKFKIYNMTQLRIFQVKKPTLFIYARRKIHGNLTVHLKTHWLSILKFERQKWPNKYFAQIVIFVIENLKQNFYRKLKKKITLIYLHWIYSRFLWKSRYVHDVLLKFYLYCVNYKITINRIHTFIKIQRFGFFYQ